MSSAIGGGANFFTGGCTASGMLSQSIDVSAYASDIDAGHVRASLSAYLGGYLTQADNAQVKVLFLAGDSTTGHVSVVP